MYRAYVSCDDSVTCQKVSEQLKESGMKYTVKTSLYSSVRYPARVFSVILPSIAQIGVAYSEKSVKISYDKQDRWGNAFVSVSASDIDQFKEAKEALDKAVRPHTIQFKDCNESQYVSTSNFMEAVKEIMANTSTYIKVNSSSLSTSSIVIYGTEEQKEKARQTITVHVDEVMCDGVNCIEINLRHHSPGLMKHLIHQYGSNLAGLAEHFQGVSAAKLTPRWQKLTLFCTAEGYQSFLISLESFKPENSRQQAEHSDGTNVEIITECCVCFESHESKLRKTFFYRLEYCGHVYCKECITQQLDSNSITFPVTCAAENCEKQFVWKDFENLFKDEVVSLRDITRPSLETYRRINHDKTHACITPDCDMIYACSSESKRFVCGQCGANICTNCHVSWHEGFDTCEAYKNRTVGDVELIEWMKKDRSNRRKCPNCSAPIEKNKGCQHMTRAQCKHYICWVCMKFFEKSGDCYDHLTAQHGGAYGGRNAPLEDFL